MGIISIIKERIAEQRKKRLTFIKKWLYAYYCRFYERRNFEKIAIPHFQRAERMVEQLEQRGLLEVTYKQIQKGG